MMPMKSMMFETMSKPVLVPISVFGISSSAIFISIIGSANTKRIIPIVFVEILSALVLISLFVLFPPLNLYSTLT